jgi:DNA-binding LytR/AlgR family response regulator
MTIFSLMKKTRDIISSNDLLNRVLYFQTTSGLTLMVLENRREVLDLPMAKIEHMLPSGMFCRVHRNYLVNTNFVSAFRYCRNQLLAIVCGYPVPVSRRCGKILMGNLDVL